MKKQSQFRKLQGLMEVVLEARLSQLQAAQSMRERTRNQIDGLARATPVLNEDAGIGAVVAALQYQNWAEKRRIELGMTLAKQTATWIEARDAAQAAFARNQGLEKIATQLKRAAAKKPQRL